MIDTLFTGKHLIRLEKTPSTNTYAKNYIANSSPIDGTVILADEQTNGRGQGANSWSSGPGKDLTLSIVYSTSFLPASQQFQLNMAVSAAIIETLKQTDPAVDWKIKWPNDMLGNGRKVCGMLIENIIRGQVLQYSVIGIGLNVNRSDFAGLPGASSLALLTGQEHNIEKLLWQLLRSIEGQFLQLRAGTDMKERYLGNLYRLNEPAQFSDERGEFSGVISDVQPDGRLVVLRDGEKKHYNFQQIRFL